MTLCSWCGCTVSERKADPDGNHACTDCIHALKAQNKALLQELIAERVITASLTEQLEQCQTCPANDQVTDYEEQKRASS